MKGLRSAVTLTDETRGLFLFYELNRYEGLPSSTSAQLCGVGAMLGLSQNWHQRVKRANKPHTVCLCLSSSATEKLLSDK